MLPGMFAACDDDDAITAPNLGAYRLELSNDAGIMNYVYALEQAEAAFYTAALASEAWSALSGDEQDVLADLQKHEVIHRDFLRRLLANAAIPAITFRTSAMADLMSTGDTLLASAQLLEDTGISAYNGAGKYLRTPANLGVLGKIVSVEARHAAAIRDIRDLRADNTGRLFAGDDAVDPAGLDVKAEPDSVLASVLALNVIDTAASPLAIGAMPDAGTRTSPDRPAPVPA